MTSPSIRSISVLGIHGHHKMEAKFNSGLNIVHGKNGAGKTTLLHVLANLLEKDIERFCHISFWKIVVQTSDDHEIALEQSGKADEKVVTVIIDRVQIAQVGRQSETPPAVVLALEQHLGGRPVYLPAFRTMLEGAATNWRAGSRQVMDSEDARKEFEQIRRREHQLERRFAIRQRFHFRGDKSESVASKTILCRQWFGPFVPIVRYPSLWDLANEIASELHQAFFDLSSKDQAALSSVFVNVLQAVISPQPDPLQLSLGDTVQRLKDTLETLKDAYASAPEAYVKIAEFFQTSLPETAVSNENLVKRILLVYANAAEERVSAQNKAYATIREFEESVNQFIKPKRLSLINAKVGQPQADELVILEDGKPHSLHVLSSGERHVLTLLFQATHMSETDGLVLIDEPELSLHVDWQRIILKELMRQTGERQIIVCTHATEVAADHREALVRLSSEPWTPDPFLFDDDLDEGSETDVQLE